MHELTIIENIVRISARVAEENNVKCIKAIHLEVGCMQHLNEEIMKHGFNAVKESSVFAAAELKFHWLEVKLKCNACLQLFFPGDWNFSCPFCGNTDTSLVQGMELRIKSIEGE